MARTNTTVIASTNGLDSKGWLDRRTPHVISGSVVVTHGTCFANLPISIPARTRVIWARLSNQTTVAVTGGVGATAATGTGTAPNAYALVGWPTTNTAPLTAPPTTSSVTFANASGTNGGIIAMAISTASAATARGVTFCERSVGNYGTNACVFQNTNTTPAYAALVPVLTSSTNSYAYQANGTNSARTSTDLSQGVFGTVTASGVLTSTSGVYFELYCEEFVEVSGT